MNPKPNRGRSAAAFTFATATAVVVLAGCGGGSGDITGQGGASVASRVENAKGTPASAPVIRLASSKPEYVTGGDALIDVMLPKVSDANGRRTLVVEVNGDDQSSAFKPDPMNEGHMIGLVTGLKEGGNTIVARWVGTSGKLHLTNYPVTGPVFSGPHQKPYFCQTDTFRIYPNGPLLGAATDENCSVPTQVHYLYRALDNSYKPYDAKAAAPADMTTTTTKDGATVPYIVRLETGTINRAIYQTAILHDPKSEASIHPTATPKGWNKRLVYPFGGGCGGGWYRQGNATGGVLNHDILSQGYGLASASLNVFGTNCNDVLSAETVMMVKERFIETVGRPNYTIGWSCSGAAMQQYMIGNNYPGLLDGIIPSCSFPDPSNPASTDARLLYNYFNFNKGTAWTQVELASASGYWGYNHVTNQNSVWANRFDTIANRPNGYTSAVFNAVVPQDARFDPVTNPTGARPTHWDHGVNMFGRDPDTGFARRAMDNVGVQYGLGALNEGKITKEQFLDLNERIGGYDINGTFTPQRTQGDPIGIANAYQTGRIMLGNGGLASMPIIDWDQLDTEELPTGDLHLKFFHYMTRERLIKSNGNADNMVMWNGGSINTTFVGMQALARMDEWLARIEADTTDAPRRDKVIRNKPANLSDGCWAPGASGVAAPVFIKEKQFLGTRGSSTCNTLYPGYSYPRGVAGEPAASDIVKCQLRPIDATDYKQAFTAPELARLNAIFPEGVCDYTKPGIGQRPLAGTWLHYTNPGEFVKKVE
jgi:hypothetical protein